MTRSILPFFLISSALAGCADSRPCELTVWVRQSSAGAGFAKAELVGSWNGWARPGIEGFAAKRAADGTEWIGLTTALPAGRHQYAVLLGGALLLDEANPRSAFVADPLGRSTEPFAIEVSEVELSARPAITEVSLAAKGADGLALRAVVSAEKAPDLRVELRRGADVLASPTLSMARSEEGWVASAELAALPPGKYTAALRAADGSLAPRSASAFVGSPAAGLEDGLVYQVMVDRFRGAGWLAPPKAPGDRAGGTLDGVRAALEQGYFERLGVTTLWLSPVYTNPEGRFLGFDGREYEGYHGYWPTQPRAVDARLGGEAALDRLVAAAHARGIRVVLDVVPNHVFVEHPYYRTHGFAAAGAATWFNDGPSACVCGTPACGWGERIQSCWFTDYLPDLDWRRPEVMEAGVADLRWWMERFDLDGLRIDAVPMMPRAALRRMTSALRADTTRAGLDGLLLGEVYTGPGAGGRSEIRAYLGAKQDGLDSAFDFPLMWSLREAIAHGRTGLDALEREVAEGEAAWAGSGSTVARMVGNHDTTRFLSEAAGDAGNDGWTNPAHQPTAEEPYRRALMALVFAMTLEGLPVLYYGDELGLAGGGDPDSRRVMPDPAQVSAPQRDLLAKVAKVGLARRDLPALRRGARRVVFADAARDVVVRGDGKGAAIVAFSLARADSTLDLAALPDGAYRDLFSDRRLTVSRGAARLSLPALSTAVYVPESP